MNQSQKIWLAYLLFILFHLCGISTAEAQPCKGVLELASEYLDEARQDASKYIKIINELTKCSPDTFENRDHKIRAYEFLISAYSWRAKQDTASQENKKNDLLELTANYSALSAYNPSKNDSIINLLEKFPPNITKQDSIRVYKFLIPAREWKYKKAPEDKENILKLAGNYSALANYDSSKYENIIKLLTENPPKDFSQDSIRQAYEFLIFARDWKYRNASEKNKKKYLLQLLTDYFHLARYDSSKCEEIIKIDTIIVRLKNVDNLPQKSFAERGEKIRAYEFLIAAYWWKAQEDSTALKDVTSNIEKLLKLDSEYQPDTGLFPKDLLRMIAAAKNSGKGRKWWLVGGTAVAAGVTAAFLLTRGGSEQLPGPPGAPGENK